ncbi:MAG: SagB/ThcOx family dehydrogenase [Bacteroidota bacterium]
MKKSILSLTGIVLLMCLTMPVNAQDIVLPAPDKKGGKPLMQALNERQTIREYTADNLTTQQLSDLLWAAWGYNRPEEKKRTAPSSRNVQEIDVYAAIQSGLYLYVAETHTLKQIHNRDIRSLTGTQDFVGPAPLNLIYVADMAKFGKKEGDEIKDAELLSPYVNTGFIAQNVYLYCASSGLGSVVRGMVPKDKLAPEMGLRSNQRIILGHTVGVPK